ncbi:hypothetical protein [Promicromonospora panici]|nr:hypothetical protein [Promicromonospora panici]
MTTRSRVSRRLRVTLPAVLIHLPDGGPVLQPMWLDGTEPTGSGAS